MVGSEKIWKAWGLQGNDPTGIKLLNQAVRYRMDDEGKMTDSGVSQETTSHTSSTILELSPDPGQQQGKRKGGKRHKSFMRFLV